MATRTPTTIKTEKTTLDIFSIMFHAVSHLYQVERFVSILQSIDAVDFVSQSQKLSMFQPSHISTSTFAKLSPENKINPNRTQIIEYNIFFIFVFIL
jgi:hypothetical protein